MTRFVPFILASVALTSPAEAQEFPPDIPDCPQHSSPNAEQGCDCDAGYEADDETRTCVLSACPSNAVRPSGRERDPKGCMCLPGYKWDHEEEAQRTGCVVKEACPESGAVRDHTDACVCPENATGDHDTDDEGVTTLLSCACDAGYAFSAIYYTCRATEEQCPANSHLEAILDDEGEGGEGEGEAGSGIQGMCRCDDGYRWTHAEIEGCVLIISDCGPHAYPSPSGEACQCEDGFFPAPTGEPGCVGPEDVKVRCVPNAHPLGDVGEGEGEGEGGDGDGPIICECNTGYTAVVDDEGTLLECTLDLKPCDDPTCGLERSDDGGEGADDETNTGGGGCMAAAGGAKRPGGVGVLLFALAMGLLRARRPSARRSGF